MNIEYNLLCVFYPWGLYPLLPIQIFTCIEVFWKLITFSYRSAIYFFGKDTYIYNIYIHLCYPWPNCWWYLFKYNISNNDRAWKHGINASLFYRLIYLGIKINQRQMKFLREKVLSLKKVSPKSSKKGFPKEKCFDKKS